MYGYRININGLPETVFACSAIVDNYNWKNMNDSKTIEIFVSKAPAFSIIANGETTFFKGNCRLLCVVGAEDKRAFCDAGIKNEISTVSVRFCNLEAVPCKLTEEDAYDKNCFLLPSFSEDEDIVIEIQRLINKYINCNVSDISYDKALCVSVWFRMLSIIDKHTRQLLYKQKSGNVNYYVKKLNYIISNRYRENLSLTKIAEEFGVSMSYLSSIYSKSTNQSFKEALLSVRMKKAEELIMETHLSLSDIAETVGMCDETYLRKCFKKFFGVSVSEFKKIKNEMTLYHEKPVRK